jgi:hypothetical protein
MINKTEDQVINVKKTANSVVLYGVLAVNIGLLLTGIYSAGSLISGITGVPLFTAMWTNATEGGTILHSIGILVCATIGVLHLANRAIGMKAPLVEKVAGILLKLPVNIILIMLVLYVAFLGYGKFQVGGTGALGGSFILDWITAATLLFLVFGVKKI